MRKRAAAAEQSPYAKLRLPSGIRVVDATSKDLAAALDYYRAQIAQAQKEMRAITEFVKKKGGQSSKK